MPLQDANPTPSFGGFGLILSEFGICQQPEADLEFDLVLRYISLRDQSSDFRHFEPVQSMQSRL